jgi:HK97 family phage portal protein
MSIEKILGAALQKHRGSAELLNSEGEQHHSAPRRKYFELAYDKVEVVRRGTDMIVNSCAEIDINITEKLPTRAVHGGAVKLKQLFTALNFHPNFDEDVNSYRRQLVMDLVLTGNCYQYWDGQSLHHLVSKRIDVVMGKKTKIKEYKYGDTFFKPSEIIHTKDNSQENVIIGRSRLHSAKRSIYILDSMLDYQENFFDNGAVPGLIIQTPNILSERIKKKLVATWVSIYNPKTGGKRPMILDGDMKVNPLSSAKFSELEFETSVTSHEKKILKALGVPPILLDSGNNANLRPNIQLFYEMTVLPLTNALISSYERFFAFDMGPEVVKVRALRPELKEAGQYFTGLVNNGLMTVNEARAELRLEPVTDPKANELREPQNITGSATDSSEGGRPPKDPDEEEEEEETPQDD